MDDEMREILEGLGESVGILVKLCNEAMEDKTIKNSFYEKTYWNGISKGLQHVQMRIEARLKEK